MRGGGERLEQVALETRDQHLRLGIAEAAVELEHAGPVARQHQPGEQAPHERRAPPRELVDDRPVDRARRAPRPRRAPATARRRPCRRCSARCRRRRRACSPAPAERHARRARRRARRARPPPLEQLLDHDRPAERRRPASAASSSSLGAADEDALAGGEPVRLDDAGRPRRRRARRRSARRPRPSPPWRTLFEPSIARRRGARPEHGDAGVPQLVGHAGHERRLGPDHDEVGAERRARGRAARRRRPRGPDGSCRARRCPGCRARHAARSATGWSRAPRRAHARARPTRRAAPSRAPSLLAAAGRSDVTVRAGASGESLDRAMARATCVGHSGVAEFVQPRSSAASHLSPHILGADVVCRPILRINAPSVARALELALRDVLAGERQFSLRRAVPSPLVPLTVAFPRVLRAGRLRGRARLVGEATRATGVALGEHVLAAGADADELDRHLELALDELDVARAPPPAARRASPRRRAARASRAASPRPAGVVEVALVRREVRGLGAVAEAVARRRPAARRTSESTSSFVSASDVIPFTRTA